jgi:uncharacterized protein YndB with AHSA1/START domain
MGMSGQCLEFVKPVRIVATEKWDQSWYPGDAVGTITFDEQGGVTTLTQTIRYESQTARDTVLKASVEHGVALGYDRLAQLLESLPARKGKK